MKPFKYALQLRGEYNTTLHFHTRKQLLAWVHSCYWRYKAAYGPLDLYAFLLSRLKVGDKCYVVGEGDLETTVLSRVRHDPHHYSFILSCGWSEVVHKCYTATSRKFCMKLNADIQAIIAGNQA